MSSVAVLVPWGGQCPHRTAAFEYIRAWYETNFPDWQICVGDASPGAQWCKAEAVRNALRQTSAQILVVADADCLAPHIGEAVQAVRTTHSWAMPHYTVHRLSAEATRLVLEEDSDPTSFPRTSRFYSQMPYAGYAGGGIAVVKRSVYASAPLDPRFIGWGQEDESWAIALRHLFGAPWRPKHAPMWHLWHPPQPRMSRAVGSHASRELRATYKRVIGERAMERNLATARAYVEQALAEGEKSWLTSRA